VKVYTTDTCTYRQWRCT